jgi:hypothetical protein
MISILVGLNNYFQWRNALEDGELPYGALHVFTEGLKQRPVRPQDIPEEDGTEVAPTPSYSLPVSGRL